MKKILFKIKIKSIFVRNFFLRTMNSPIKLLLTSLSMFFSFLIILFLSIQVINPKEFSGLLSFFEKSDDISPKIRSYENNFKKNYSNEIEFNFGINEPENLKTNLYSIPLVTGANSIYSQTILNFSKKGAVSIGQYEYQTNNSSDSPSLQKKKRNKTNLLSNQISYENTQLNIGNLRKLTSLNKNLKSSDMNVITASSERNEIPIAPNDPGVPIKDGLILFFIFAIVYSIYKVRRFLRLKKEFLVVFFVFITSYTFADGTYSIGTGGDYASLSSAVADLNNGVITGNVVFQINSNLSESDSIVIKSSGTGSCSYSSLLIRPIGGKRKIESSASAYMLIFDGADNVTFDGKNSNGDTLELVSTATGANVGVLKFKNDANSNTIINCYLKSNSSESSTGIIMFDKGTDTGNSSNTLSHCDIGPYNLNLPLVGIYSAGLSSTVTNNNTVLNCNIHDIASTSSGNKIGIHLYDYSYDWTISGNSFYFTDTISQADESNYFMILLESGNGSNISENYIGGSTPSCTGNPTRLEGKVNRFYGISGTGRMSGLTADDLITISNNIIQNIQIESVSTNNGNNENPRFVGIKFDKGRVEIKNNLIGSNTAQGSIDIKNNSSANCYVIGIYSGYYNNGTNYHAERINNNIISGISMGATSTKAFYFSGIRIYQKERQLESVSNNIIGSETLSNSIQMTSGTGTSYGILYNTWNMSDTIKASRNQVNNFSIIQKSGLNAEFNGLYFSHNYNSKGILIDSCSFVNMDAKTNSAGNLYLTGLRFYDSEYGNSTIDHLNINNLKSASSIQAITIDGTVSLKNSTVRDLTANYLYGINYYAYGSNSNRTYAPKVANNLIVLGENNTNDIYIYGMNFYLDDMMMYNMSNFVVDFYHNTFIVTGASSGNSNSTYCAQNYGFGYGMSGIMNANFNNNIFYNDRSSTGDVATKYYALYSYSYDNTLNYTKNLYYSHNGVSLSNSGTNYNSTPISGEGGHTGSVIINPLFSSTNSSNLDDFRPTIEIDGDSCEFATDLSSEPRSDYYTMGALQQISDYFWNSTTNDNYTSGSNWADTKIARSNSNLNIQNSATQNLSLDQDKKFKKINFGENSNGVKIVLGNNDLTVDSIVNPGSNNYIKVMGNGKLKMNIPSGHTKLFPIGNDSYSPVTLTNNTGSDSEFSISLLDSVTYNGTRTGQVLNDFRVRKTINLSSSKSNSGSGYNLKLDWNNADASNLNNPQFFEFDSILSSWKKASGTTTSSTNSASLTGYKGSSTKFFVGSIENLNWDGGTYSGNPTTPDFFTNLTINGNNLASTGMVVNDLTVSAGKKFSHNSGTDKILGNLLLKSSDNEGDAQLLAQSPSTVSGQTILEKTIEGGKWYFFSLPFDVTADRIFKVENGVESIASWGDAFEGEYVAGRDIYIAEYDTYTRDQQSNGYPNFNGGGGLYWKNLSPRTIEANKGYIVALDGNSPMTFRFKSTANASTVNYTSTSKNVSKSADSPDIINHSWNLIGNPYLSGFDLKDATNHKPYYLYNGSTYKTIIGDLSDEDSDRQMSPYSAFFCQAFDDSSTLNFASAGKLLKSPSLIETPDYQIIKLGISGVNSLTVQDALRFRIGQQFSDNYVLGEDAVKMASLDTFVPQIYTNFAGIDLSVNSISDIRSELKIVLYIPEDGNYKLNLLSPELASMIGKLSIYDNVENKTYDISSLGEFSFRAIKGQSERFTLLMSPKDYTKLDLKNETSLKITNESNLLSIIGLKEPSCITITDLNGRIVFNESNSIGDKIITLEKNTVFVLSILSNSQQIVRKINIL